MEKAHWFRTLEDTRLAFHLEDFIYLRENAENWRNDIREIMKKTSLRQRSEGTYDYLENVYPGLANKVVGLSIGAWIEDKRPTGTKIYKYMLYSHNIGDEHFYYRRLRNYDERIGASRVLLVTNGLNCDTAYLVKPDYGFGQFSPYVVETIILPFLDFVLENASYDAFVKNLYAKFLDIVPPLTFSLEPKAKVAWENDLDVKLDENWQKRYLDLLKNDD